MHDNMCSSGHTTAERGGGGGGGVVQHMGHLHTMYAHHIRVKGGWREDTELGMERASEGGRGGREGRRERERERERDREGGRM